MVLSKLVSDKNNGTRIKMSDLRLLNGFVM